MKTSISWGHPIDEGRNLGEKRINQRKVCDIHGIMVHGETNGEIWDYG
jgi:hypothetical protein